MTSHLRTLEDLGPEGIANIINLSVNIKKRPQDFANILQTETLLMLFEKASLRTRLSFEAGMTQLGGHAIFYSIKDSPLGRKETLQDTARCAGRYVDIIMARVFAQEDIEQLASHAGVPVINGLTDMYHPCQIIADLMTIKEKKGRLKGLSLAFLGDSLNNVTHSLLLGCSMMGISITVACPDDPIHSPDSAVIKTAEGYAAKSGSTVKVVHDAKEAVRDADVVVTDSWMSYHIPPEQKEERVRIFSPFQVDSDIMALAKKEAIFMNCLPAMRGMEQTAEVIDGPQSVVFDEAENRLHSQKAVILTLLNKV
ncbi:MAG: ornithine carbamoyltransferase [archaeon]